MRLLAVDIGNSRIKCALFDEATIERTFEMASDRLASGASFRHALRAHVGDFIPQHAAIASVVPDLDERISQAIEREFMLLPTFVRASDLPDHLLDYRPQASLGADRIAAWVGGHFRHGSGPDGNRPLIVVDAGTAVTFEMISAEGKYLGGAIWAGPRLVVSALNRGTSLLPEIDLKPPRRVLGTDTESCLRVGVLYGFLDGVAGILRRLRRKAGRSTFTVATGGDGAWLAERLDAIDTYDADLVFDGIRLIATGRLPQG